MYIVKGATNESLSQNPVLKDLSGKGHDLSLFNFAFNGRSGVGLLPCLFTDKMAGNGKGSLIGKGRGIIVRYGSDNYNFDNDTFYARWDCDSTSKIGIYENCKIRVSGLSAGMRLVFGYISMNTYLNPSAEHYFLDVNTDGIHEFHIEKPINYDFCLRIIRATGSRGDFSNPVTIELLSYFEDALAFDGVDDYAMIQNYPNGFKAIMMVCGHGHSYTYDQRNNSFSEDFAIDVSKNGLAYGRFNNGKTYINGIINKNLSVSQIDRTVHLIGITNPYVKLENTVTPVIGTDVERSRFSDIVFYSFVGFNDIPTENEMKQVADYYHMNEYIEDI